MFTDKIINRLDLFLGIFSQAFLKNHKILGIGLITILILMLLISKDARLKVKSDFLAKCLLAFLVFLIIFFTIYPDIVWDYYLIGLPIIYLVITAKIFNWAILNIRLKFLILLLLPLIIFFNFEKGLVIKSYWEGDGATYRNQKMVIDYIVSEKPNDYSLYAYSPAIFDYPFDYLVYWYAKRGVLQKPQEGKHLIYLIIRDDSDHTYILRGWYGDKTKDKTTIAAKKRFPGDLIVEKHLRYE